jgi:hypothetical protein
MSVYVSECLCISAFLHTYTHTQELDSHFYLSVLPFLIGSMGTMVLDVIIIGQYKKYGPEARAQKALEEREMGEALL